MSQGSIIKREGKRGVSYLLKYDVYGASGERVQRYKTVRGAVGEKLGDLKKRAEVELRRLLTSVDNGAHIDPSRMTLNEWFDIWLNDHVKPNTRLKTYEGYRQKLAHVRVELGALKIQQLTTARIQRLYSDLESPEKRKRPLHRTTVRGVHTCLTMALDVAVNQDVLARNPAKRVTVPKPVVSEEIRALEPEALDELLKSFEGHDLELLAFAGSRTGARIGELLALPWSAFNLDSRKIRIARNIEETTEGGLRFVPPKTQKSRRTISIDDELATRLRSEKLRQAKERLALGQKLSDDDLIFNATVNDPTLPRSPNAVSKLFIAHAKRVGIPVSFHDLRHTHITNLLNDGVPVHVVSSRAGHASPMITLTIYAHVLESVEERAAQTSNVSRKGALYD